MATAAFLGALIDILPKFPAHINKKGEVKPGIAEFLTPIFGAGSFNEGRAPGQAVVSDPHERFARFIASGLPLAQAFGTAWKECQERRAGLLERLREPPVNALISRSPLLQEAKAAGCEPGEANHQDEDAAAEVHDLGDEERGPSKMQQAIMHEYSLLMKRLLDSRAVLLPTNDPRRRSYCNIFDRGREDRLSDKCTFSSVLFSSLPNKQFRFPMVEFVERFQNHFGLPCSLCLPLVGQKAGSVTIDAYSQEVYNAKVKSRAAQRRNLHDTLQHTFARSLSQAGETAMETPPHFMTSGISLSEAQAAVFNDTTSIHKIIPDLVVHLDLEKSPGVYVTRNLDPVPLLIFDVKTVNSSSRSATSSSSSRDETGSSTRRRAVDTLADSVPGEYGRRLERLDREVFGTADEDMGPFRSRLVQSGAQRVQGLAIGRYCEASSEVLKLLSHISKRKAESLEKHYPGRRSMFLAGIAKERVRREWALCAHKGWSRLKVGILQQVKKTLRDGSSATFALRRDMRELELFDEQVMIQGLRHDGSTSFPRL